MYRRAHVVRRTIMCDNNVMDINSRQLVKVEASQVLGEYTHSISIDREKKFTIIFGPNGVGKTKMLEIIHSISRMNTRSLQRIPFGVATLYYSDESHLRVARIPALEYQENGDEGSDVSLEFTLCRPNVQDVVWRSDKHDRFRDWVEKRTSFVEEGPDTWRSVRDDEVVSTADLISRYGYVARNKFQENEMAKSMIEINKFLNGVPSFLIETQRLKIEQYDEDTKGRTPWGSKRVKMNSRPMITRQSEIIRDHLARAQTEHSKITQAKDRTFPRRVLTDVDTENIPDSNEIAARYDKQNALRTRLARVASMRLEDELSLPERQLSKWELRLLEVYLDDAEAKLEPLVDVLARIEMLEAFVNDRLLNKTLEVNDEEGLVVKRRSDGESIALDSLSSGEQHEIILLVDMLFNVDEGSVVLIDEPEISLHVAWQLEFIPMVAKIAELIGFVFIVATHSPQIINGEMKSAVRLGPSGARFS